MFLASFLPDFLKETQRDKITGKGTGKRQHGPSNHQDNSRLITKPDKGLDGFLKSLMLQQDIKHILNAAPGELIRRQGIANNGGEIILWHIRYRITDEKTSQQGRNG